MRQCLVLLLAIWLGLAVEAAAAGRRLAGARARAEKLRRHQQHHQQQHCQQQHEPTSTEATCAEAPPGYVATCRMGVDFHTVDELLERSTPCVVQGLETTRHNTAIRELSPTKLFDIERRFPVRVMKRRKDHTPITVMYRDLEAELSPALLGIRWPLGSPEDDWDWKYAKLQDVLSYPGLSCSLNVEMDFNSTEPLRVVAEDLAQAVCPYGCPSTGLTQQTQLWLASGGLGHDNHFDAIANVFFHLHGTKHMVLCAPDEILRKGHLYPSMHPSARHSQVRWSSSLPDTRQMLDFPNAVKPEFNASAQLRVTLRPGDVLYMPAFWGHQTFSDSDKTPTISLAMWFSTPASNPYSVPGSLRGPSFGANIGDDFVSETFTAMEAAKHDATHKLTTPPARWAALRLLAARAADGLFVRHGANSHISSDDQVLRWATQRWRPLFESLGVVVPSPLPESLCQSATQPEGKAADNTVANAAAKIVRHIKWATSFSFAEDRGAVQTYMFHEFMDHLVDSAKHTGVTDVLVAEGLDVPAQLGALIASFSACPREGASMLSVS